MVSQRERLKERGLTQVSVWLPDSTVERMKALALARELSMPKLIESALLALEQSPDEPALSAVPVPDTDALANMRAALAELNQRVSLLEHGLKAAPGGAGSDAMASPLSTPYLEEKGAETADYAAVVALESRADILAVSNKELPAHISEILNRAELQGARNHWKRTVIELAATMDVNTGTPIAKILKQRGIVNSKGKPFQVADIDRILKKYGLK